MLTKDLSFDSIDFVPISAIRGDNIVKKNEDISWYQGKSIVEYLLAIRTARADAGATRLQIQNVIKDDPKRYYQGFLSSGTHSGKSSQTNTDRQLITFLLTSSKSNQVEPFSCHQLPNFMRSKVIDHLVSSF